MISDSGIWYPDPIEKRIAEISLAAMPRPRPLAVRARTWICDGNGKILRRGQEVWNTITDYGMDWLANTANAIGNSINYLVLSSALGPGKKVLTGGTTLSITSTANPASVPVTASANFFASGDVGNTLYIDGLGQEMQIISFTSATAVTCATRPGVWLPGITPSLGPFSTAGVHYTATNTVATEITRFATYDTSATNYNAILSDYTNKRFIHQRIFLSGAAGSSWTINQLGWSPNSGAGNNVFGKVNLITPDSVAIGQKYRVQLDLYSGYTPIQIASFSANWGATIGTYTVAIQQEEIDIDTANINSDYNFLCVRAINSDTGGTMQTLYYTGTFNLVGPYFYGDPSFNNNPHGASHGNSGTVDWSDAVYTSGTFVKQRTWKMPDTIAISAATGIVLGSLYGSGGEPSLTIKPATGTITKPSGYYAALTFPIYWTRQLTN